ncbi:LytR C-terminal domain-containing protein [Actinokineospora bangkokensis]|uniref:LytR/CpsA/Psr regulator C-terminal domain-containing protein n=1 Tax=Actinokineospora bangkokensis TaxID=1193682 RepID=A0A1Q9LCR5_9PSEU|nr:LytR C-terminal domain-containing protein [Actinokineospora bangkokensis]OLR89828.1 hypothetical protein BJP25_02045 [Actinokineospora bangkokensis]
MSTEPTGPARPGRLVGLALMGVAAVAAVIGVVTLVGGNGDSTAEPAPTSTTAAAPTSGDLTSSPAATSGPPASSASSAAPTTSTAPPTTTTTTTAAPPVTTTAAAPPPAGGGAPDARTAPIRVYNNSTIKNLAERASQDVSGLGWTVTEVGNYSGGTIRETTVYFTPGTAEEAAANQLAKDLGVRVEPRFEGISHANPGVILIVTREYAGPGK